MKLTFSDSELNQDLAPPAGRSGLSLKLSLSALSYACTKLKTMDPLAPHLVESEKILSHLMIKSYNKQVFEIDKYPKIIVYML